MPPNDPDARSFGNSVVKARLVVGADGMTSIVGRSAGVYARRPFLHRMGITFHRADPSARAEGQSMEGRFVFGRNWYIGVAPVPGGRVNIGIVAPAAHRTHLPPQALSQSLLGAVPGPADAWASQPMTDHLAVAGRLEHHVTRSSGRGYLLVGDAIEFIDPLTGEGLLRALMSAELAADAIAKLFRGDRSALEVYDRRIRARWRSKNLVSWILQAFLARPTAFDYALRRLATRRSLRSQLTLVLTDQQPATRALDPRFLARLLAP